jgi:hypothetical protein
METKQDEAAATSPKRSGSMSRRKLCSEEQADHAPPQRSGSMPAPTPKVVVINDQADEVCPQRSGSMPTKCRNEDLLASPAVPPIPQSSSSFHSRRPKRHGTKNSNFSAKVDFAVVEDEAGKAPEDLPSSVPGRIRRLLGSITQSSNVRSSSKASGTQSRPADQKSEDEDEEQLITPSPSGSMASTSAFMTWRPRFFRAKTAAAPPSASSGQPVGSASAPPGPHYADSDASRVASNQLTNLVPTPPAQPRRS